MGTPGRKWVRWNKQRRTTFLDHLAGTCNVKASSAAAGVDPASAYALQRRCPEFAAQWEGALRAGYQLVETQLVGHVLSGARKEEPMDGAIGPMDVDLALRLLTAHRNALNGKPNRGGPPLQRATRDETDKAILKQLEIYEKRLKAQE